MPPQDAARMIIVPILAIFVLPRIVTHIPDFDPLLVIIGLFVLIAGLQHLGFVSAEGTPEGGAGGDRPSRGPRHSNQAKEEDRGPTMEERYSEAERCIQQNNYDRAKEIAKQAADVDPESARAWELLATAQKWSGQREEALATVKKAKDIYEVESDGLSALLKELGQAKSPAAIATECETKGEDFISKRMYDLATPCYSQAIEALESAQAATGDARSLYLRLLRRRAECSQQLQDWGQCRRDATTLLEEDPNDAPALLQRAAANEALEKFKAALDDARKLLAVDPKSAVANRIVHNCQKALRD